MRLIDADKIPWTDLNDNPNSKIRVLVTFADKVNRMPTIEPEQIVRCKDCKWFTVGQKGKPWNISKRYCNRSVTIGMNENDYCSRAERKDA